MRITSKGQVTIPRAIRRQAGFLPHTDVEFEIVGKTVRIVKSAGRSGRAQRESRGERAVRLLRSRRTNGMSTDEIMALTRAR